MANDLNIRNGSKTDKYQQLLSQLEALISGESDFIANLANISAGLKEVFNWLWIGFYRVDGQELVLGPFQGPIACSRISYGKGVCGSSWLTGKSIIVPDVNKFSGHIACSSKSKSEIVIPVINANGVCIAVLDIDSQNLNEFDIDDEKYLTKIINLLSK